jgi:uncharacterized DUF497 family protein
MVAVGFEWDADKARGNARKHDGVRFEESKGVFEDPYAITIDDDESDAMERRLVSVGMGGLGRSTGCRLHVSRRSDSNYLRPACGGTRTGRI